MGQRAGARVHPAPDAPAALLTITDTQPHDPTGTPGTLAHPSPDPHQWAASARPPTTRSTTHQRLPTPRDATTRPPRAPTASHQQTNPTTHEKPRLGSSRVVPETGFEPACPFGQSLLRRSSQPVAPLGPASRRVAKCGRERKSRSCWSSSEPAGTTARLHARLGSRGRPSWTGETGARRTSTVCVHAPLRMAGCCVVCRGDPSTLPQIPYTYLLGLYLGDGYIASHARGVYKLRI